MKRRCMISTYFIMFLLIITLIPTNIKAAPNKPIISDGKWEYLVISFGKTLYSNPISEPELKEVGLSKLLPYAQGGLVSANEAVSIQYQMDKLGNFGWELVDIVGAIGGDQQLVFKRLYDKSRSEKEIALIMEEGKILSANRKAIQDEISKIPSGKILDLDAAERQEKTDKEEKILREEIASLNGQINIKGTIIEASQNYRGDFTAKAHIVVDGTTTLLKGNKYRRSEAKLYAKQIAEKLYTKTKLYSSSKYTSPEIDAMAGDVTIKITVVINYQGKANDVATHNIGGKRDWSK